MSFFNLLVRIFFIEQIIKKLNENAMSNDGIFDLYPEIFDGYYPDFFAPFYEIERIKKGEWEMINTNHMQMRNCDETRNRLNELFLGDYGTEFIISEK